MPKPKTDKDDKKTITIAIPSSVTASQRAELKQLAQAMLSKVLKDNSKNIVLDDIIKP